jgi:adenosylcobinamide amidohydrolase
VKEKNEINKKLSEKPINISIKGIDARVIYQIYRGHDLNTTLVSFGEKRRVLSTLDGLKKVFYIANTYNPYDLSIWTMANFMQYKRDFPLAMGISPRNISFLSTGVNMDDLALCEKSYKNFQVSCIATAGAKGNALRTGVEVATHVEQPGSLVKVSGTINLLILTNSTLTDGAMARAIITATEAKTAALQDLNVRSTAYPQYQATGTGTDNVIVASGTVGEPLLLTSGHTKMGELIGCAVKEAVTEALHKFDGV